MLTKQGGLLEQALIEGGVNPLAANTVMGAVANCAQALPHRGPVSLDYTPQEFRYVTQQLRKFRFQNMDRVDGDMPPIKKKKEEEEEKKSPPKREDHPPEQRENRNVRQPFDQLDRGGGGIAGIVAGPYITVDGDVRSPRVSLAGSGGQGDVATFSYGRLTGVKLSIRSDESRVLRVDQGALNFKIVPIGEYVEVVTGVEVAERALRVTTRKCFLLDPSAEESRDFDHKRITYLANAQLEDGSLTFESRDAYVVCGEDRAGFPINIPVVDCEA